nr:hypothetical protein [Cytophagales bacterium]
MEAEWNFLEIKKAPIPIGAAIKMMQGVKNICCITDSKVRRFFALVTDLPVKLVLFKIGISG